MATFDFDITDANVGQPLTPWANEVDDPLRAGVAQEFHRPTVLWGGSLDVRNLESKQT
jgi:hypothetical protein